MTTTTDRLDRFEPALDGRSGPGMSFDVRLEGGDFLTATVRGTVCRQNIQEFGNHLGRLLATGAGWVTVDLSAAALPDPAATAALDQLRATAARNAVELKVVGRDAPAG